MATAASVAPMSVEEYLRASFEPDADYVDGVIEERNLGTYDHAGLQSIIDRIFGAFEDEWGVRSSVELRVRVGATRFRIPDICLIDKTAKVEQIPTSAPLLCVEVLSPEDRLPRVLTRAQDFHAMGVGMVWVFDPVSERVWVSTGAGEAEEWTGGVLRVAGTRIELDPAVAFAKLRARR